MAENSRLIKPSTKNDYDPEKRTYPKTAARLFKWTEPETSSGLERTLLLRLQQFESSDGLKQSFIENEAIFHKQCLNKYDKLKLAREREKAKKRGNSESVGSSGEGGLVSPSKFTRLSRKAPTFSKLCFFCEGKDDLTTVTTLAFDNSIRKMAGTLEDSKLLTKLAEGKLVTFYIHVS